MSGTTIDDGQSNENRPPRNEIVQWFTKLLDPKAIRTIIITIISLIAFVVFWQVLSTALNNLFLPPPGRVFDAFITVFQGPDPATGLSMWNHIWASLQRFILGFLLAFVIAVPLGLIMGFSKIAEDFGKPIVEIFRPIPPIAWIPFLLIVLGSLLGPVVAIFIGVFFPVLSNVIFGVKSVDPILMDAARTLGSSKPTLFRKVIFPSTVPYLMTGITIGLGIGWMCIVAAEFFGARGGGVGQYIIQQSNIGKWDFMFAGLIVIAILGFVTIGFSRFIEKRVSKWMGQM
jgi:ABC-type nitrate/sulfonate/bicarbonate transport system permease component